MIASERRWRVGVATLAMLLCGCTNLDRFDTADDEAYCGPIVGGQFVREGFSRTLRAKLTIDTSKLDSIPGSLSTDDANDGPCAPAAQFETANLRSIQKALADPLSTLEFGEEREHNFLAWVESSCRGTMLAVVSLMRNDDVELRLLAPPDTALAETLEAGGQEAFGLFQLKRRKECGF